MNENKKNSLSFFLLFFMFFVGYKSIENPKKMYKTISEKKKLCEQLGCQYIDQIQISYPSKQQLENACAQEHIYSSFGNYQKKIQQHYQVPLYIAWVSDAIGYGLFAGRDIKPEEYICEYTGIIRREDEPSQSSDYAWTYTVKVQGNSLLLDAKHKGNEARFANHVSHPNCQVMEIYGLDGLYHICYIANKAIKKHEQITVSYGDAYWQTRNIGPENL